jgi:pterin-4a-carbinolamine dehydratase
VCRRPIGRCWMARLGSSAAFRFKDFREAFAFVARAAELAEAEGHHPDITFGWGYATVSLRTKKIKGLHENDFIMAAKLDRLADDPAAEGRFRIHGTASLDSETPQEGAGAGLTCSGQGNGAGTRRTASASL